jgi:hypothetical protein
VRSHLGNPAAHLSGAHNANGFDCSGHHTDPISGVCRPKIFAAQPKMAGVVRLPRPLNFAHRVSESQRAFSSSGRTTKRSPTRP